MTGHAPDGHGDTCLWRERPPRDRASEALDTDVDVEVAVLGAGIVGLTTAVLASEKGLATAVVEAREVGAATSGATTGKFSVINGLRYARLRRRHGRAGAAAYAMAARSGIARAVHLVEQYGIECGLEHVRSHLAVTTAELARSLDEEAAAATDAGLRPLRGWGGYPLDLPVRAVLTFRDEMQLHPVAYLDGLAAAFQNLDGFLHERSPATRLRRDGPRWLVSTPGGNVRADHVVVATRLPVVGDHRFTFARATPVGACAIAGVLPVADLPRSSALIVGDSTWSVRASRWPAGDERLVLVGPDVRMPRAPRTSQAVEDWALAHWPDLEVTHRWFAQDQQPVDDRPLIGRIRSGNVWAATGFGKWGLSLGTYAAERIVAGIVGEPYPVSGFFEPRRVHSPASVATLVDANLTVARRWVVGRLGHDVEDPAELGVGEGRVRRVRGRPIAEGRDVDGTLYRLDARCTHLGCPVTWNAAARTWDCRCHGARFAIDGRVLESPATEPLAPITNGADRSRSNE